MDSSSPHLTLESTQGQPETKFSEVWRRFFARRVTLFLVLFLVEILVFFVLPALPFLSGEQDSYGQQAKHLGDTLRGKSFVALTADIYSNNMKVGLVELIPGVGPFFFGISLYETARVTQAIATTQGLPPSLLVLSLFILPHSWIELPAYAVSTGESLLLLNSLLRWLLKDESWRLRMEMEQLLLVLLVITLTLLVAAVFEVTEVQVGLEGLLLWAPFGLIAALVLLFRRRVLRTELVAAAQGSRA